MVAIQWYVWEAYLAATRLLKLGELELDEVILEVQEGQLVQEGRSTSRRATWHLTWPHVEQPVPMGRAQGSWEPACAIFMAARLDMHDHMNKESMHTIISVF